MTQRELFVDAFDLQTVRYEIHEAASPAADDSPNAGLVDGENILARVVGTFFLVDGKSRNGRFYTKELWQKAIKRTNDRMVAGQMLGTIGHSQPLDDAALLQGLASHRVARLWIDEVQGVGMGEILVLNTPSGRVLNAYLRGGVQFPVSSRGYGGFRNEKRDGAPVIDEDSFDLETFDFVRVPGVAIALPKLVESLDPEANQLHNSIAEELDSGMAQADAGRPHTITTFEEREMSNETAATISALARQKADVEDKLTASYSENETLRNQNEKLESDGKVATKRIADLEAQLAESTETLAALNGYKALGTVEAIQEVFSHFKELTAKNKELSGAVNEKAELSTELEGYRALGSVEEISKAMDIAEKLMAGAEDIVVDAGDLTEKLAQLGTPEEINTALNLLEGYGRMATPAQLEEAVELLNEYIELGSVSEVRALIARTEQMAESLLEQKLQATVKAIADDTGAPADVVSEMLESFGEEGTRNMLGRLGTKDASAADCADAEAQATKDAVKAAAEVDADVDDNDDDDDDDDNDGLNESVNEEVAQEPRRSRAGSLTASLMEQFATVSEDAVELSEQEVSTAAATSAGRLGSLFESCQH